MKIKNVRLVAFGSVVMALLQACATSGHAVTNAHLGQPSSSEAMEKVIDQPGPIVLETVTSADWVVPLSGLLNLEHPLAKEAGLKDREEPIQVYAHVIKHPTQGIYLVDTGVPNKIVDDPESLGISWIIRTAMHLEKIKLKKGTADIVSSEGGKIAGVFLTHAHLDHIMGMPEVPNDVPVYVGKTETTEAHLINMFVFGTSNNLLAGKTPLLEWQFQPVANDPFIGVVDIFGDASVFAISVPGHTSGSVAYLVRTKSGPVLLTGDASHTRWGWEHGVEPGDYTRDHAQNAKNLMALKALVARHPSMVVRLGHQR